MTTSLSLATLKPRYMYKCDLHHPFKTHLRLDSVILAWFPAPNSFTGEDVVEIHAHGSLAVTKSLLGALETLENFRLSEPGEFTQRAFYNNKMDLTQVEGLGDLIHSETESQRLLALSQMNGSLKTLYEAWRQKLIQALANVCAYIDFSEEENIECDLIPQTIQIIEGLISSIGKHLNDQNKGEILRNGIKVVVVGLPNVGKSSFINFLTRKKTSIVSSIPGTTRDLIQVPINIGPYSVLICDTAGIREFPSDEIEQEGIDLAFEQFRLSQLKILLFDAGSLEEDCAKLFKFLSNANVCGLQSPSPKFLEDLSSFLFIANKTDLCKDSDTHKEDFAGIIERQLKKSGLLEQQPQEIDLKVFEISLKTQSGLDQFLDGFVKILNQRYNLESIENNTPLITKERHRANLLKCLNNLQSFIETLKEEKDMTLAAENLQSASNSLGKIIGIVDTEHVLDVLFKDFCIGK